MDMFRFAVFETISQSSSCSRLLTEDPNERLGAKGAAEVLL